jgi:glycosyltransferase involved in cell wall biosynthesis
MIRATLQLCTYNRAHLLARVLEACFEQNIPSDSYEVVLVNDGSRDGTPEVIEAARAQASCAFTVVNQENAGLARARNRGIARARGERIVFIDDDVLPVPSFLEEHLRSHERTPEAVVRGAVINTASFERLPVPVWTPANYSGNFFWTTNVSAPLAKIREVGAFSESFREYGWEDIELGMRLRAAGLRGVFNRFALAFHYKPAPEASDVEGMLRQARAQARTAVQLRELHPHWRVVLATADDPLRRSWHRLGRTLGIPQRLARIVATSPREGPLAGTHLAAARALAREMYFAELELARRTTPDA